MLLAYFNNILATSCLIINRFEHLQYVLCNLKSKRRREVLNVISSKDHSQKMPSKPSKCEMVYQKLFDHIGIDFNFGSVIEFQLFPKDFQMIFVTPLLVQILTYFFYIFITSYITGLGNGYTIYTEDRIFFLN